MATTIDTVAQDAQTAYNDAKTLSDNALTSADLARTTAESAANGIPNPGYFQLPDAATVTPNPIPVPLLPTTDFSTDVKTAFDYAFAEFNQVIQPQILNYLTAFFPDIATAVKTGSDQWLIDTMTNGRIMPADVENALWNRARDKEINDSVRSEQALIDASASRGFITPDGVLNYNISINRQETDKRLATIERDIAVKAFDVANENSKFAVAQAIALRTAFVSALGDFIKTAMIQPNNAAEYAKVILASKTGLYDSAVRLYSAQIDEERMRTGVELQNGDHYIQRRGIDSRNFDTYIRSSEERAKIQADTALAAAEQLARVAAAALATRNTMVSVAAGV